MTKRTMQFVGLLVIAALVAAIPAHAQTSQDTLKQYVSDLQKSPNDNALREKIIRHVQSMKSKPAVPPQAEKFEGRAEFAAKSAKTAADFADAASEYKKALLVAPWVAAYYFNLGVMQEKSGQTQEAKQSFELYLLAAPDALDARDVRKRIAGLEYAMEKAAREPVSAVAEGGDPLDTLLRKIDGRRYVAPAGENATFVIDVVGRVFVRGVFDPEIGIGSYHEIERTQIQGHETTVQEKRDYKSGLSFWVLSSTYIVGEDGNTIILRIRFSNGEVHEFICLWQR